MNFDIIIKEGVEGQYRPKKKLLTSDAVVRATTLKRKAIFL